MPFQLKAKNLLLTYAQCPEPKEDLLNFLKSIGDGFIRVGRELHTDGHYHLHACMRMDNPVRTKNERFFDWKGYHPNIVACRAPQRAMEYAGKDGDFIDSGILPSTGGWADACGAQSSDEFWNLMKNNHPRDYIINHEKLEYYANKKFKKDIGPYEPQHTEFIVPVELEYWADQNLQSEVRRARSARWLPGLTARLHQAPLESGSLTRTIYFFYQ